MALPYAEDLRYWKTSNSAPSTWMDRTVKVIEDFGGAVKMQGWGQDINTGAKALIVAFHLHGDDFKVIWPVCPSRSGNDKAAERQAATLLHHDIKARIMSAEVLGARMAFFQNWLLPDGRMASEASVPQLAAGVDVHFGRPQLPDGDVVDGSYTWE